MAATPQKSHKKQEWLTKGGLAREDSDDELGIEDVPWRWIYDEGTDLYDLDKTPTRKRKAKTLTESTRKIKGAQMGSFTCYVGDTVLLKSPEQGKDWAGIISHFSETNDDDEEEMSASIMWFCSPEELSRGKKSRLRTDLLPNESFITADFNLNPLESISGKAIVLSKEAFYKKYPGGRPPRSKAAIALYGKTLLCRRGLKQRTGKYTDEFVWEEMYQDIGDLYGLVNWINEQTKGRRKPTEKGDEAQDKEFAPNKHGEEDAEPETPKKRRKTASAMSTPKSSTKSSKFTTPTHKRIVIKKPLEITPLGTRLLSPSQILSSPYQHARTNLHVASVPASLPGREKEFSTVYKYLHDAITDGTGACIYIAGTPGTGKTATVREVVAQLNNAVLSEELDDFNFVEINGMKVTDPHQSYSLLWEALKGDRVSPSHALDLLEHEFSHPSPRRKPPPHPLVTKNQSVMYNFFNWPQLRHSRLNVLAVANTMDLPERTLSNKISSRLGLTTITFPGYDHKQLMSIITSRLQGVPGNIVDADAIQFAARKVAVVTGDARRALDICRRAVEIAEQEQEQSQNEHSANPESAAEAGALDTPSKKPQSKPKNQPPHPPPQEERAARDVLVEAKRIADVAENQAIHDFLLVDQRRHLQEQVSTGAGKAGKAVQVKQVPRVLAMGAAAMELLASGVLAMEARARGERSGKIRLRVGEEEVRGALRGDEEVRGLGFSG
ncbi:hypothetical protein EPUS_02523 [Endocarpon pusillum Z07020]|uniref:Origin recognition complex subunit 1 n=1 Tax=Endocarpon pusillum (strain Z07020 / HMAS-L-300199) TaxID=1263415 RepID=U1G0E2_ENDPU|nr:uncharacterized protein EPUS_02523 [Endocarpon pusillum Z07020]ERF70657.1 hypothetical protein EPUS_02523 [Endocarpon pusillum Z07020]